MLHFEPVTPENWRTRLTIREDQQRFVAQPAVIMARAWAYREQRSRVLYVCDDDTIIGMMMWHDSPACNSYVLSELLIDEKHQRRGCGKWAVETLVQMLRAEKRYPQVMLCYVDGDEPARRLYEKCGFQRTYDDDEDELVMALQL